MFGKLNKNIDKLNKTLEERNLQEIVNILGNEKEIFKRNFLARY